MRSRLEESGDTFEEAVTVNQRGLIDKILARYSTEHTLFRELLQNADDAKAKQLQIRFNNTGFWEEDLKKKKDPNYKMKELSFKGLRICNNGMVFRDQDWNRIKSIADGNPDETKVGFFGVGFYSVFSMCEDPTVLSGAKALSFHWKKDALYVTHGKIPSESDEDSLEEKQMFRLVKDEKWTVFDLPVRADPPHPKLPLPREIANFLVRCLTFTYNLELVEVYYDGKLAVTVGRQNTGKEVELDIGIDIPKFADPKKIFTFEQGSAEPLLYAVKFYDENDPMIVEMMRVQSNFNVNVNQDFKDAMRRVTKKNPPKSVKLQLLFDIGNSILAAGDANNNDDKGGENKRFKELESFSPSSSRGGFFFIGSGITQQTTGSKCHCNAPFMPTMERNAMDLADETLATWNLALVWVTGALERLAYEHRCNFNPPKKKIKTNFQNHAQPNNVVQKTSSLFSSWFGGGEDNNINKSSTNNKNEDKIIVEEEAEEPFVPKTQEEQMAIVHASMGTFAIKKTTPVERVGKQVAAGFFDAIPVQRMAPTVWTDNGPMQVLNARIRDDFGLHEFIKKSISFINVPVEEKKQDSVEALKSIGKSALGFFSSIIGGNNNGNENSRNKQVDEIDSKRESIASLCAIFVNHLQVRGYLKSLTIHDLVNELNIRELESNDEVVKFLKFLLKRKQLLGNKYNNQRSDTTKETVKFHCKLCGLMLSLTVEQLQSLRKQTARANSSFPSFGFTQLADVVHCRCTHCKQVTSVDAAVLDSSTKDVSNVQLLRTAKFKKHTIIYYQTFMSKTMSKRIEKSSMQEKMYEKLEDMFWKSSQVVLLPKEISKEFQDKELLDFDRNWPLKQLEWIKWSETCLSAILNGQLPSPLPLETLALVTNVLRVLAFANYHNEIDPQTDTPYVFSLLQNTECLPVKSCQLKRPHETYLSDESTGGFKTLPILALCDALEDGSYVMTNEPPRDPPLLTFLKQLSVKEHVDLNFVFEQFNSGKLEWNRQEILFFFANMRSKLNSQELSNLRRKDFLPKMDKKVLKDPSDEKRIISITVSPSLASYNCNKLFSPSPELFKLGLPLVYPLNSDKEIQIKEFFVNFEDSVPASVKKLLKELGVKDRPDISTLLNLASPKTEPDESKRSVALKYLLSNFQNYESFYNSRIPVDFIPCNQGKYYPPTQCFLEPKVELLGKPFVDFKKISKSHARLLGVLESPDSGVVLDALRNVRVEGKERALQLFEYLGTLLPRMNQKHIGILGNVPFVPVYDISKDKETSPEEWVAPNSLFFKPAKNSPGKYEGLFQYIYFGQSSSAIAFLRAVGVRSEPTILELATSLSKQNKAQEFVDKVGHQKYLQILRLIALEWGEITPNVRTVLCNTKWLIGKKAIDEEFAEDEKQQLKKMENEIADDDDNTSSFPNMETQQVEYLLCYPKEIYISDNAVVERMFDPIVAPQESVLENMYTKLGCRSLSTAVKIDTQVAGPFSVTKETVELEALIRLRMHLFLFKADRSIFKSQMTSFMRLVSDTNKHFIFRASKMKRTMTLDNVTKDKTCSAFGSKSRETGNLGLFVTIPFSYNDCASELCKMLLKKPTLHLNLLWSTILQRSNQELSEQGFPIRRKVVVNEPVQKKTKEQTVAVASAPPPPPPQQQQQQQQLQVPPPKEKHGKSDRNKEKNDTTKEKHGKIDTTTNQTKSPPPAPEIPNDTTKQEKECEKNSTKPKSFRKFVSSLLSSSSPTAKDREKEIKEKQKMMEEFYKKQQLEKEQQQQISAPPPPAPPATLPKGKPSKGTGDSLLENQSAREKMLKNGLSKLKQGNTEQVKTQGQQRQLPGPSNQEMPMLDDLHPHDLVPVPFSFCGIQCYVERQPDCDPYIFETKSVEATAFAQLLLELSGKVFKINPKVCNIYYHHKGATCAFNKGGTLFFNFSYFLGQLEKSNLGLKTKMGPDLQPLFISPKPLIIDWFGIFCHELSHNNHHPHDSHFANIMMFYFTAFYENLTNYLTTISFE